MKNWWDFDSYKDFLRYKKKPSKKEINQSRRRKRGESILCVCGKVLKRNQNLCTNCKVPITKNEGVKFIAPDVSFTQKLRKTGIICSFKGCETLTERMDTLCFTHTNALSKSKKYKVTNTKKIHILPSLKEFKKKLHETS